MFNYLRKLHNYRRSRAFMIKEARRHMDTLSLGGQTRLNDNAILDLVVGFGVAYLQTLAMAKQLRESNELTLCKEERPDGLHIFSLHRSKLHG